MMIAREGSELPMPRTSTIGWIVLAVVLSFSVIIIALFTGDWGELLTEVPSMVVGCIVGSFSMLGAFRRFGWGESAARSIFIWSLVGGLALILFMGIVLGDAMAAPQPNLATVAYWLALGVLVGAVARAGTIRRQLRTAERP
jgi:hypothetical protein